MKLIHAIGRYLNRKAQDLFIIRTRRHFYDALSDPKAVRAMRLPPDVHEADWPPRPPRRTQQAPR